MRLFAQVPLSGEVSGFAQVGEWLKPTDCKSVPLRRYGGSNPPLCTRDETKFQGCRVSKRSLAHLGSLKLRNLETWNSVDDQEEVRAGFDRLRGARRFSLDHAVGRADSSLQWKCETEDRNTDYPGTVCFPNVAALLANPDRRRAGRREAGGLKS